MSSPSNSAPITIEPVPSIESILPEWTRLAEHAGNVFLTPEWASTWWRHFGRGHRLCLRACRDEEGRLAAIIPLYYWRDRPLRVLRFVGHGPGDELGPVCAPDDLSLASIAINRVLERERYDVFLGDLLPGVGTWTSRVPASRVLRRYSSPVLLLTSSGWEQLIRSRNWKNIHRREIQVARSHDLHYRQGGDAAHLDGDLDAVFSLHAARWGTSGTNFIGSENAFQREFAALAQERGWLRVWFLELDGQTVAAWFGFFFAGAAFYYQSGRDPAWDKLSVGTLLMSHTIKYAFEDGVREYRFLRGGESYKFRFTSSDAGLETIALAGTRRGRIAILSAACFLPLNRTTRRLLPH
jgi:CelD/BcsL family acetyltransferase involved in cellulose biosynthesis